MVESTRAHATSRTVERKQQTGAVMLAVSDDGLRYMLRLMLEDAGYEVLEAHSGPTAFTLLLRSHEPVVVLLERYLRGANAAERLLTLAADTMARHRFLLLAPDRLESQQGLQRLVRSQAIPVLTMPFEFDDILHEIAQAHYAIAQAQAQVR